MNSKKDITINTAAFNITIHWNGPVVSTQFCILAGVMLLKWISHNTNVATLCNVILILDVLSVLVVMFMGGSDEDNTAEGEKKAEQVQVSAQSSTPVEKGEKKNKTGSASEENVTVKKRVPLPTQKGQQRPQTQAPPAPESAEVPEPAKVDIPPVPANASSEELTEEAINDLFNW